MKKKTAKKKSKVLNKKELAGCGPRIREWRKDHGIKGYELSKTIKVSQGSLSDIENGKSDPCALTIQGLYLYTDIDIGWMLTGEITKAKAIREMKTKKSRKIITLGRDTPEILIKRGI